MLAMLLLIWFGVQPHLELQLTPQLTTLTGSGTENDGFLSFYVGNASSKFGFAVGGFGDLEWDWIGVGLGVSHSSQGWHRNSPSQNASWDVNMTILQIPLEMRVFLGSPDKTYRPYLTGGVYFGHLLSTSRSDYPEVSEGDVWASNMVGFSLGAGINYEINGFRVGGQLRIRRDLTTNFVLADNVDTYNQSVGLSLIIGI
jgi:opacity protein-like surface antigen